VITNGIRNHFMNRSTRAKLLAAGLLSATTLGGCSGDPPPGAAGGAGSSSTAMGLPAPQWFVNLTATEAPAGPAPAPAAFTSLVCSSCHKDVGQGNSILGPEIRHIDATYATWVVRTGRGNMAPYVRTEAEKTPMAGGVVTDAELTEIITWLNGQPKPTTPDGLYRDFCGNCHGPNGTGGAVPTAIKGLSLGLFDAYVRGGSGADPAMRNGFMPKFDDTKLTAAELQQITTFLGAVP
jgi:mono/diheme cytochrome c family protein